MSSISRPAALALLLMGSMLGPMAGATIIPVLEVMRSALGVSGTEAGLIITTHGLAIAVFSPVAGWIVDRWGVRRPLVLGLLLYALAGGAGIVTNSYSALIISRAMFGIGAALVFTGTTVAMLALWQGAARNRVMGWRTTATSLGGVAFPVLGGGLATLLSWHAAFGVYLVGLPIALAVLAVIPQVHRAPIRDGDADGERFLRMLKGSVSLAGIYGLLFALGIVMYSAAVFLPQRLSQLDVTAPALISVYIVGMAGTASLIGLAYGRIGSRFARLTLLLIAALMWVAAFAILGTAQEPVALMPGVMLLGLGNGLMSPTLSILIAETVPEMVLGRATAVSSTMIGLGQFSSPVLLGPIMAATSIGAGYLLAGAAALTIAAFIAIRMATFRFVGQTDVGPATLPVARGQGSEPPRSPSRTRLVDDDPSRDA